MAVFKINVAEFPNSFNVYDSYGEALMKGGQEEAAIVNYKKSLELHPANTTASDALTKMGISNSIKVVTVDESVLATYVGVYEKSSTMAVTITQKGNQLFSQGTGQAVHELFAKSPTEFFLKIAPLQVTFLPKDGQVDSFTVYQNGIKSLYKRRQ